MKTLLYIFALLLITMQGYSENVTLRWDANTEIDLEGYKIYYRADPTIPYSIATSPEDVIDQGPSPVIITILDTNDPNYMPNDYPKFTMSGFDLTNKDYWFVVTAYDDEEPENESGFSNEVNTINISPPSGDGSSGGESSGGGCFIQTITR